MSKSPENGRPGPGDRERRRAGEGLRTVRKLAVGDIVGEAVGEGARSIPVPGYPACCTVASTSQPRVGEGARATRVTAGTEDSSGIADPTTGDAGGEARWVMVMLEIRTGAGDGERSGAVTTVRMEVARDATAAGAQGAGEAARCSAGAVPGVGEAARGEAAAARGDSRGDSRGMWDQEPSPVGALTHSSSL